MRFEGEAERVGFQQREVVRHHAGGSARGSDSVVEEMPVALVCNGISHAVMMATPRDLECFALGFALSEGVVDARAEVYDIELRQHAASAEVELTLSQRAFTRLKEQRRTLAGRSGCGICGIESLAMLDLEPARIVAPVLPGAPAPAVARAARELAQHQTLMRATGGAHAAAWCRPDGAIDFVFEDVGRHNSLDKLIGHLALSGVDPQGGFVFMSSRASYELARKAARLHIPMLATISAPSSLAIDIAQRAGLKLLSFCRQDGCVEYC
ncbi:formate dehydrogenase accessory sulfurtransferase FdhD [Rugamonas sp. CCM 8940]|uniref:formate dehydrogenase accessory sulfurtransferase FdhD n=1 Tax=Rugamonas sp. CCM 8940 TaxID=2765359 RepID=UPI0018F7928C|nr:formate dehydrogenase accessory sulfurtransferase FdhD [Rugamonas sp. CCM 8940]MBJ7313081.1 formate dehydrogenase accessory sulfurtransferase FdhD [Rugamonas sp. CCM 8940]